MNGGDERAQIEVNKREGERHERVSSALKNREDLLFIFPKKMRSVCVRDLEKLKLSAACNKCSDIHSVYMIIYIRIIYII